MTAKAIEAGTAETARLGPQAESAVPQAFAQTKSLIENAFGGGR